MITNLLSATYKIVSDEGPIPFTRSSVKQCLTSNYKLFQRLRRRDGDRLLQWNLPAQHLPRLVRQLQIPVARERVAVGIERKE